MASSANITLHATLLRDEQAALRREWLVTNGLGGYASASVAGANTRRYHGLLVAALNPPVGRAVLLSKLEETLEIAGADGAPAALYELSANLYPGVTHPQGFHALESWSAYPAPTWVWSPAPGIRLEKRVWMASGQNTTYIGYRLLEAPPGRTARLRLVPLLAWKDYHSEMRACDGALDTAWENAALRVTLPGVWRITPGALPLILRAAGDDGAPCTDAAFAPQPVWYYRFQHPREQERGLEFEEDLYSPGTISAPLSAGKTLNVIASAEETEVGGPAASRRGRGPGDRGRILPVPRPPTPEWDARLNRQNEQRCRAGEDAFAQRLALAADDFLVEAPGVRSTVIAGYHWFGDWGRDTMIALPGLCLATGRPEVARAILLSFAATVDQGMLPNRFPDVGETPEYNTVDATLWYFAAIYRYVLATGDFALVRTALWSVLEEIIGCHQAGTRYNIHVDPADSMLSAGQPGVQLTWMDARVGEWVVTPRIGKPVEINALWHNALRTMAHFAEQLGDREAAVRYDALAHRMAASFAARFPRPDGRGLYDVLDTPDGNAPDASVRPNQIFALSLPFAPLEPTGPVAASIRNVIREELLTPMGLRTLSPRDPAYCPLYGGDQSSRDGAYHQGTAWPWLLGPFAEAHYRAHGDSMAALEILRPLRDQLANFGLGFLAEVADGDAPHSPNGCIAQAWSVAETLRVWKMLTEAPGTT